MKHTSFLFSLKSELCQGRWDHDGNFFRKVLEMIQHSTSVVSSILVQADKRPWFILFDISNCLYKSSNE